MSTTRVGRLWSTGCIWSLPVLISTFYWNTARLIHLCFVYDCSHVKVAELKSWNRDQLVHKTTYLLFAEKNLLTPNLPTYSTRWAQISWHKITIGSSLSFLVLFFFNVYLFIWLCQVLDAACGIFSCSTWDLVPWPGIKPWPPALGARSLSQWTIREVLSFLVQNLLDEKMWAQWYW